MSSGIIVCLLSPTAPGYQFLEKFREYESVNAVQKVIPGGVYTTFRTFQRTRVINLNDHFARLRESARILDRSVSLQSRKIRKTIRQILADFLCSESRVRLSLDLTVIPGDMYILIEPLKLPNREDYERGVRVCTRSLYRDKPKAKSTDFVVLAEQERSTAGPGVNEIIMTSPEGILLEGLSSNFFAVKDGVIWTEDEAVLSGMTRKIVLGLLKKIGLRVRLRGLQAEDISCIQEAFITSASRGVLPVTRIDDVVIGDGNPGVITWEIMEKFEQEIVHRMVEI